MNGSPDVRPSLDFVVTAGIDNGSRPSGGNIYDRRMSDGLGTLGWQVVEHPLPGDWPHPAPSDYAALAGLLDSFPDGALVLIDGLIALSVPTSSGPGSSGPALVEQSKRLRLVILVHMLPAEAGDHGAGSAVERSVLSCAAVITTSQWTKKQVVERHGLPPDNVHVVTPGADPAEIAGGTAGANALLCVAAVSPVKGHDVLLDALAAIAGLDWMCRCVGALNLDPDFTEGLRGQAADGGIAGRVQFLGPLAAADVAAEFAAADVLVLASRTETYGMVLGEALARGIPVIATNVGGVSEALGAGAHPPGLLVPPEDPPALAAALRSWLGSAGLRQTLQAAARERRQTLGDWTSAAAQLSAVLGSIAAQAPRATAGTPEFSRTRT